jgi:hypothetical protein
VQGHSYLYEGFGVGIGSSEKRNAKKRIIKNDVIIPEVGV